MRTTRSTLHQPEGLSHAPTWQIPDAALASPFLANAHSNQSRIFEIRDVALHILSGNIMKSLN